MNSNGQIQRGERLIPYDENYIETMFAFWYNSGRIPASKIIVLENCPKDQFDRIPSRRVLEAWVNERAWRERADVLDAQVSTKIDDKLVARKVAALDRQASQAKEVGQIAFDYILENGFDSSASATAAFIKAAELERLAVGLSKNIQKLAEMDDDEVLQKVKELAERANSTTIIDASEVSEDEDAEPLD
jgi:hypothetical protein